MSERSETESLEEGKGRYNSEIANKLEKEGKGKSHFTCFFSVGTPFFYSLLTGWCEWTFLAFRFNRCKKHSVFIYLFIWILVSIFAACLGSVSRTVQYCMH